MPNDAVEDQGFLAEDALLKDRERLTTRLNVLINKFADHDGLLLSCLWRDMLPGEAPAWYDAAQQQITINAHLALGTAHPRDVNPLTRAGRRKHPEIIGLLAHEASHAHSTATTEEAIEFKKAIHGEDPALLEVFTLLEEPRIEYRQITRRPHDRYYLRAQSVLIDLAPFTFTPGEVEHAALSRWKAATVALLVYGRVDAGILNSYDAHAVHPLLVSALGASDLESLRSIQWEAIQLEDGDLEGLADCARRWRDVVGTPVDAAGLDELLEALSQMAPFGCGGGTGDDAGDGDPDGEWENSPEDEAASSPGGQGGAGSADGGEEQGLGLLTGLGEALKQLGTEVAADVAEEAALEESSEASAARAHSSAKSRESESKAQLREEEVAAKVFGPAPEKGRRPGLGKSRMPTAVERRLAREVGLALKRAQFRDRVATKYSSLTPPGRLNGRDAMLGQAQKSMGNMVTARPFRSKRTRHSPEPPIRCGIMTDVSGSMAWAEEALASASWVLSHSMSYVVGTVASVIFGEHALPLTRPGELPDRVQTFRASGGWERFGEGFGALNGALGLTSGVGVRMLVVVSDSLYMNARDARDRDEALARMKRSGGIVLWVGAVPGTDFPEGVVQVPVSRMALLAARLTGRSDLSETVTEAIAGALASALRDFH